MRVKVSASQNPEASSRSLPYCPDIRPQGEAESAYSTSGATLYPACNPQVVLTTLSPSSLTKMDSDS